MKKTALFLAIILVFSLALTSCDFWPFGQKECTEHVDANGDYICDNCEAELKIPDLPPECEEHKDEDGDEKCDDCGADVPASQPPVCDDHKDEDGDGKCDDCGEGLPVPPNPPVCEEHKDENGDYKCDNCDYVMFESVSYSLDIGDLETGTRASDEINGKFTILSGTEIRNRTKTYEGVEYTKSVKLGSSGSTIKVSVPGAGKLRFIVQNGSSGAAVQYVKVTDPADTVSEVEIPGTDAGSPLYMVEVDVTEGDWLIQRVSGTVDVYYLELECVVAVAPENGFELVSAGKTDFLTGDTLDISGIQLNAIFENGKTDSLAVENVTVDTSKVDMTKSGVYDVTISYKEYDPITYKVRVFAPESIELGFDAIEKLAQNSSAGNGVYFNQHFREVYAIGEELDTKGLSVIVVAKCGDDAVKFKVDGYEIAGFDSASAGKKTLTVSANGVSATTVVYIVDAAIAEGNQVKVDKAYAGEIGAVVDGYNMFTTIHQALEFLARVPAAEQKLLVIGEGLFTEKLEITIPNLTIKGAGADKTIIEWDSLYGLVDAGGFTHTTDSTQTVAIREGAVNCVIENLTISNYWNTQERLDEAGLAIERNLALLVQADRFIMKNSALLAIQDTLELFTGRQYFENVFISGYTDFIFGTNNTTYFKNCTIHTIDTGKDDSGTAGYITAFKGSNKGASDSIVYGAIFDGCRFTADEGVMAGKTAIGRTWGAYAAVAVINSELGEHISLDGYDKSDNKNKRYISMNGIHPTDETVQFVEYNNTGAGAITEAVAGMRFLTADEAALYADFATIFGKINGNVSYLDPWDPSSDEVQVDDRDYYYFNGSSSATGSSHTFDTATTIAKGATLEWEGLLISAENGNVAWNSNANSLNMKAGAFIKFTVPAGTSVTVETYPNYNYFTLNGVGTASANMLTQYYAEQTEVVLLSTGDLYLYSIIIDPNSEAPAAPTLSEIKVSGMNTNYVVGDEISLEGLVVKAIYSDNSVVTVSDYTVDSSAVVTSAAGEYEVVISYGEKSATVKVIYEDPNAGPEISKDTLLDFSTQDGLAAVQNNPKITIDGSVRHNGAEIQIQGTISFQVKAGTLVKVTPYANVQYASYTIGEEGAVGLETYNVGATFFATKDCTVVYTGLSNNYLVSIEIVCPLAEGKYVFGGKDMEGDVTGILASIPGMSISGTCKTHSGGAQLGQDSIISFAVPAFANVTIQGFDTSYGLLQVLVDGVAVEMDEKACYVFSTTAAAQVTIKAVNAGTEDAPAYNKSYITYIEMSAPTIVGENLTVNFGSAGNYKDCGIDFSGITIADNGGNNSQIKNGSFSFVVKAGAIVTVNGFPSYTSYVFGDGEFTSDIITDTTYVYTAEEDRLITISHSTGNNYFYSFSIEYPVVFEETTTIDLSASGANIQGVKGKYEGLNVDATNGKFADNGSGWTQVNAGTVITLNVLEGAEVSVAAYTSADNFDIVIADGVCTITCVANDYLKAITVKYAVVYAKGSYINLSATGASIQGVKGEYEGLSIDATNGKFADNGSNWTQVNAGTIITFKVEEGAEIVLKSYTENGFTVEIANGVCTVTCTENNYLSGISIN